MIPPKEKKCNGIGKASGFKGCGKPKLNRTYGLCPSCLFEFYTNTDKGKVLYHKCFLPKVSKCTEKRQKEQTKSTKEKVTKWNLKLQDKVNEIVRIIDNGLPCLARNFIPKQMHAGHVYARGGNQTIRYHLHNLHRQSAQSNHYQNDDGLLREGIVNEYGQDYMDYISNLRQLQPLKYRNEDYHEFYKKACKIANRLRKTITEPLPVQTRISLRNEINLELGIYPENYCVFNNLN